MNDIIRTPENGLSTKTEEALTQMAQVMRTMADMMRTTNERMETLEKQVRSLTKVTPMQASAINEKIRERAQELAVQYRLVGAEKALAGGIRKEVRLMQGVQAVKDIARCDYQVTLNQIALWDDYKTIRKIRQKMQKEGDHE